MGEPLHRTRPAKTEDPTGGDAAEWVRLDALTPWSDNPRRNEQAVDAVAASLERFGWGAPIVARRADGMIIAGHTRALAAAKLGMETAPVRFVDLDEDESRALALADNRTAEIAEWDDVSLVAVLRDLDDAGASLAGLGWDAEELGDLLDVPDLSGLGGDGDSDEEPANECPRCGHRW